MLDAYVNRPEPSSVTRGHLLVHGLHGIAARHLTELLVHVVRAGTRVVAEPDAKVLDFERLLLVNLENG